MNNSFHAIALRAQQKRWALLIAGEMTSTEEVWAIGKAIVEASAVRSRAARIADARTFLQHDTGNHYERNAE